MKTHTTSTTLTVAALALACLFAASHAQAGDGKPLRFSKLPHKATFIYGDNLVTRAPEETGATMFAAMQTPKQRADGLSAVMVTPNGTQYEAKVSEEDLALFERAIADMERLGIRPDAFSQSPKIPVLRGSESGFFPTVVIGADNRVQITNTVANPYWHIGRIAIGCTGTLITPKHVLTAGHCVSNGSGTWYSSLNFTVAQNGTYQPWGTATWARAVTTTAWHNNRDTNYDYGMIVLNSAPHGGNAGWGTYSGGTHTITGYPGDKPTGTMWTHSGSVSTSGSFRLCYTIDTAGGQSGSGIYDSGNVVRGVHTTGSSTQNCGTRLTTTVYNTLQNWITTYP